MPPVKQLFSAVQLNWPLKSAQHTSPLEHSLEFPQPSPSMLPISGSCMSGSPKSGSPKSGSLRSGSPKSSSLPKSASPKSGGGGEKSGPPKPSSGMVFISTRGVMDASSGDASTGPLMSVGAFPVSCSPPSIHCLSSPSVGEADWLSEQAGSANAPISRAQGRMRRFMRLSREVCRRINRAGVRWRGHAWQPRDRRA